MEQGKRKATKILTIVLITLVITLVLVTIVGFTYSWYANRSSFVSEEGEAAVITIKKLMRNPKQALNIVLTKDHYGIPGESVMLTETNALKPLELEGDCAFKITYYAEGESRKYLKDVYITDESLEGSGIVAFGKVNNEKKIGSSYYGVYAQEQALELGDLIATYGGNLEADSMGEPLEIRMEVMFCQLDENAFQDFFDIEDADMNQFDSFFVKTTEIDPTVENSGK